MISTKCVLATNGTTLYINKNKNNLTYYNNFYNNTDLLTHILPIFVAQIVHFSVDLQSLITVYKNLG